MVDDFGIPSELDRVLSTERLRDPKNKGARQDTSRKKKGGGKEETVPKREADPAEAPVAPGSGKILDVLI